MDQGDAPRYLGRTFRHLLSAGFIYLMLVNAFPWMSTIMQSFAAIGSAVSGVPKIDPTTVLGIGGHMAETIYNAPTNPGGMISDLGLVIGQTVAAFFILLSFAVIAALALLVIIEAYLVVGGASILLAFGGSRRGGYRSGNTVGTYPKRHLRQTHTTTSPTVEGRHRLQKV